jgi:hypothetical protein
VRAKSPSRVRHRLVDVLALVAVCAVALTVNARCQLRAVGKLPVGGSLPRGVRWRIYDEGFLLMSLISGGPIVDAEIGTATSAHVHVD